MNQYILTFRPKGVKTDKQDFKVDISAASRISAQLVGSDMAKELKAVNVWCEDKKFTNPPGTKRNDHRVPKKLQNKINSIN